MEAGMACGHGGYLFPLAGEDRVALLSELQRLLAEETCAECGRPVHLVVNGLKLGFVRREIERATAVQVLRKADVPLLKAMELLGYEVDPEAREELEKVE